MQNKGFWAIVAIFIVGAIALIVFAGRGDAPSSISNDKERLSKVLADDHVRGKADSSVVLIEYGDVECPACAAFDPIAEALHDEYKDRVAFVFRHYPITNRHPYAMIAARAVEAASKQGKFFELTHMAYQRQSEWVAQVNETDPTETFVRYAGELGLNVDQFRSDMTNSATLDKINRHRDESKVFEVSGTPTLILNGEVIQGRSLEEIKGLIDAKLQASSVS